MNPQTARRLVHVKAVYVQGVRQSEAGGEIDGGLAVVAFDNALEMMMYTCLESWQTRLKGRKSFEDLVDLLSGELEKEGKKASKTINPIEIKDLHKARNAVQHQGHLPSRGDVERYLMVTETVLGNICREVFSMSLADISLGQLIKNQSVQTEYLKADAAFAKGKFLDCMISCACAFDSAMRREQSSLYGSAILADRFLVKGEAGEKLLQYIEKLDQEVEVLKLRLDYKAYQKFREILASEVGVAQPFSTIDDFRKMESELHARISSSAMSKEEELRPRARFCLDFTVDSILRWETLERKTWFDLLGEFFDKLGTNPQPK